jgi:hypothetical protein
MRALVLTMLLATPTLAAPDTRAFLRYCEARTPAATCSCIASEMARTRNGQIALDAYGVTQAPAVQQRTAALALANKYGAKASEIETAITATEPALRSATGRCL